MKKKDVVLKEYVRSLSDEELKFVCSRLSHVYGRREGDVADTVEKFQENPDMDRLLASTKDADALYEIVDEVSEYAEREIKSRSGSVEIS